jgi:integrase
VHLDEANARKAIAVPLNADAIAIVQKQIGKHQTHVFSFHGKPITQVSTKAWYAALARAGITDFRWHDLQHTWSSWHVQQGSVRDYVQNRLLRKAGWSWYEVDCRDRPEPCGGPHHDREEA